MTERLWWVFAQNQSNDKDLKSSGTFIIVHLRTSFIKAEWQYFQQGHSDIYVIYIEDATYGKISLQNNQGVDHYKGKDFVALPHSWRLVITWGEDKNFAGFC